MNNKNENAIKILSLVAMVVSFGANALYGYVSDKKMEATIDQKVQEALAEKSTNEES